MVLEKTEKGDDELVRSTNDLTLISDINIDTVNSHLKQRYQRNVVYTYSGTILISVNPYKELFIYDEATMSLYHHHNQQQSKGILPPHIFSIAESAYENLKRSSLNGVEVKRNQSIVISGESGAGKTETTKFVLNYLCHIITSNVNTWVEHQILEANTILEAFGNAKTVRNDNSSRFGKFMQVCFDRKWLIKGCIVQDYLLEQSRITQVTKDERNYHVFYQLIAAAIEQPQNDLSSQYNLSTSTTYNYLGINRTNPSDCTNFTNLILAFQILQIPSDFTDAIFKTLSAILWLGNLVFDLKSEDSELAILNPESVKISKTISALLNLEEDCLNQVLLTRQINVRGNITEIPLRVNEASENRHAMAKALYSRTFAWLINWINNRINPGEGRGEFLGLLDIFGFENFTHNSFEQFCINYTNEKLHKFFNHEVFNIEQEIYKCEGIVFSHISFTDNTACLELIEKTPRCLLKLLTEQCHLPRGSDGSWLMNISNEFFGVHPCFTRPEDRRTWEKEFTIIHYAGPVTYKVEGFVDKNRDVQQDLFFHFLSESKSEFIQQLCYYNSEAGGGGGGLSTEKNRSATNKCKPTVSDAFRIQLQALVDVLQDTMPWYVRCIKPNMVKESDRYDESLVLDQLKYLGMLDIIRIRREGYPVHQHFHEFVNKFKIIGKFRTYRADKKSVAKEILDWLGHPATEWQLGNNKVFLRGKVHEDLETRRLTVLNTAATKIQATYRGFTVRRGYRTRLEATLILQRSYRRWRSRLSSLRRRRAAIVIQSHLRGMFGREVAVALREMRRVEEGIKNRISSRRQSMANLSTDEETTEEINEINADLENLLVFLGDNNENDYYFDDSTDRDSPDALPEPNVECTNHNANIVTKPTAHAPINHVTKPTTQAQNQNQNQNINHVGKASQNNATCINQVAQLRPTLPEPTVPPPPVPILPPPPPPQPTSSSITNKSEKIATPTIPTILPEVEPIYESIKPRCNAQAHELQSRTEQRQPSQRNTQRNNVIEGHRGINPQRAAPQISIKQVVLPPSNHPHRAIVTKKLQELEKPPPIPPPTTATLTQEPPLTLLTFALNYFNDWTEGGSILKRPTQPTVTPKEVMICYTKNGSIPSSHLHLYDPSNINLAITIFKDLQKYMHAEFKAETELLFVQNLIGYGLQREELRDEIYVQIIRMINGNYNYNECFKLLQLLCFVSVCFPPGKILTRFIVRFLAEGVGKGMGEGVGGGGATANEGKEGLPNDKVTFILNNFSHFNKLGGRVRSQAPSSVEIKALERLGTIVCRFFFLDGRTKAIDVHPMDTSWDAMSKLSEKIGLSQLDNSWAIYSTTVLEEEGGEEQVPLNSFLYDVIAQWEIDSGEKKKENRFVFKKRLFKSNSREIPQDPVEVNLLYAQAVHDVVKVDAFPISEKVSLQLCGLQLQVLLQDYKPGRSESYSSIENYLPHRVLKQRPSQQWGPILEQTHKQYGAGKSELVAKVWYLSCVMQYPLYGSTLFNVNYRGYWLYGNTLLLGISSDGISMIKSDDKFTMYEYSYKQIESISLESSENLLTINLNKSLPPDSHKCFVFESVSVKEMVNLIGSYCPSLSSLKETSNTVNSKLSITNEDRYRLYINLITCRKLIVESGLLRKWTGQGNIMNTLRKKLNKSSGSGRRRSFNVVAGFESEFPEEFWTFTKYCIGGSITMLQDEEDNQAAVVVFQMLLQFAGVVGPVLSNTEEESSHLQSVLEKCWRKDALLNELYAQLIKQTTEHPDPNSRVNARNWSVLSLISSLVPPSNPLLRKYLNAHLKRCGLADTVTLEGRFARFAEKCLHSTISGLGSGSVQQQRRQWSPSKQEILCTINCRPITSRFYLMDGKYHVLNFTPNDTAADLLLGIMNKIGLGRGCKGYSLYELGTNNWERSLLSSERPVEVMARWEKQRSTNQQLQFKFVMKKHLFVETDTTDPVENELVYHQLLHQARNDRFPVSETEAAMLVALQAQVELGDYRASSSAVGEFPDYCHVSAHCLPTRIAASVSHEAVARHHQSLVGTPAAQAKQTVLNLLRSWPLHRASIYDVTQSFTSNWPRGLWLAVDQSGVHLLQQRSRHTLCSFEYEMIVSYSPSPTCFMLVTNGEAGKQSKIILNTNQGYQISQLIKEYIQFIYNLLQHK